MNKTWRAIFRFKVLGTAIALLAFLIGISFLKSQGYLDSVQAFLGSEMLTFTIGSFSISAYEVLKGMMVVIICFWITSIISTFGDSRIQQLDKIKASNRALLGKGFQISVYFVAFILAIDFLGIDLTGFAIFSGAIGFGVGFGLQKITSNFISGLILLFEKSIEEGDFIEFSDHSVGYVKSINARYTLIETLDGKETMVPNEEFIANHITNWTYSHNQGRLEVNVGVAYGSDLDLVHKLIIDAAIEHPECSKTSKPDCFLDEFADSSVNFKLFFWVDDVLMAYRRPKSDVMFSIWRKFKENNIEIPFPQRDVHVKS